MQKFILPGFYEQRHLNENLIELYKERPYVFRDNVEIECFFGSFQLSPWDGGRVFATYKRAFKEDIVETREFYNNLGFPIRLTFTNPEVTYESLKDPFSNLVLHELNNGMNEVLISSDLLEQYIRANYSKMRICSSTTKCLINPEEARAELDKDYHQICIDYNLNKNKDFIDSLTQEQKDKTEILCNAICPPGCRFRKEHYRLNGLSHLNAGSSYSIDCSIKGNTICETTKNYKNNLSIEDIAIYEEKGFSHFKLEGRTLPEIEVASNYVLYLIKPEYQIRVLNDLLK